MGSFMTKKVLQLRSSGGLLGAESVIIELAKHSPAFGYQSIVGAIKNAADRPPEFLNVAQDYRIDTAVFEADRSLDLSLAGKIRRYIRENHIDVLHCHGYKEDFYSLLANPGIPMVATNHLWKRTMFRSKLYARLDAFMLRFFDQVVGVSDEIVAEMDRLGISHPVKIANGVDTERFHPGAPAPDSFQTPPRTPGKRTLGMISSLTPEKGHRVALQAIRDVVENFPDLRLLIVGDGIIREELYRQVSELGLDSHVVFLGKRRDIPEILSAIDIFILPSYKEGLPIALLEAMAAGKAVIATRVGENANVVIPHETGILIEPGDVKQLAEALEELFIDRTLLQRLGDNARAEVEARYSSRIMARLYCELYTSVINAFSREDDGVTH